MSCPCGGDVARRSLERTTLEATLDHIVCRQCGRVGGELLLVRGEVVLQGTAARQAFAGISAESAEALWSDHQEVKRRQQAPAEPETTQEICGEQFALFA